MNNSCRCPNYLHFLRKSHRRRQQIIPTVGGFYSKNRKIVRTVGMHFLQTRATLIP